MPTYEWINLETGEIKSVFRSIKDYDKLPDDIGPDDADNWTRKISAPAIAKRLIPSGFGIRQSDQTWVNGKEINKLEDSKLDLAPLDPQRAEITKEVNKIKKLTKKK